MLIGIGITALLGSIAIAFILVARSPGEPLSRAEVAQYIEDFLERGDYRDWDEFMSMPIEDPELDRIREACSGNETNPPVLRALLDEVRGRAHK